MKKNEKKIVPAGNQKFSTQIKYVNPICILFFIISVLLLSNTDIHAQSLKGKISGKLVDFDRGEPLIYANVQLEATTLGAASDLEGNYLIRAVPPGIYTVIIRYMGYTDVKITDVRVAAGKVTKVNASLKPEVIESEEVVVTAKALRNTEAALLKDRQKALAVSDAVSAEAIARAGGGNAAEAMKQVTGASVVEGKYVYIRGLGDRYTSTQLNGAEIPSTNPYKRAGSIDLIPSNLIDNIVAVKTFTPDKPGNFSGGTVDIRTKDFPDKLDLKFSTSTSYNSQATFNDNGPIGYNGGGSDWLGMDNGTRDMPSSLKTNKISGFPAHFDPENPPPQLDELVKDSKAFNPQMAASKMTPPLNQSYSFSIGNQINVLNKPLGFLGSLSYSRNYSSYDDGQYNIWNLGSQKMDKLTNVVTMNDTKTTDEVLWGGLLKASYKLTPGNIVSLNFIYNINGESTARYLEGQYEYDRLDEIDDLHQNHILGYNERRLSSFQLNGEHQINELFGTRISWRAAASNSKQDEPDIRYFTCFAEVDSGKITNSGTFTNIAPTRLYRFLDENSKEASIDIATPFKQWRGKAGSFKFGGFIANKARDFSERRFVYNEGSGSNAYNGDPDAYFSADNIGWYTTQFTINNQEYTGYSVKLYLSESGEQANDYTADQNISAYYAMLDLPLFNRLRLIGGGRCEITDIQLESVDPTKANGEISTRDILPSINFIYNVKENMNLRTSFTRTLARPNFRELAPYATYDFSAGFTHIGNPKLKRTLINNFDMRWEWFSRPGEIYAVSAFYKSFKNPIERAFIVEAINQEITWENVDNAQAMGLEFEIRKKLDIISERLKCFMIGANLSLVNSKVDISEDELELMRLNNPDVASTRELEGQSPYLLNLNLSYDNLQKGITTGLYYNIFGERLSEVNKSGEPYVYEQPVATLNATFAWQITDYLKLKLAGKNLLDAKYKKTQEYKGKEYIFRQFTRGRTFSVGLGYNL